MEMLKLMVADGAAGAVTAMADGGLLLPIFGGVAYTGPFAAMIAAERCWDGKPDAIAGSARWRSPSPRTPGALRRAAAHQCRNQGAGFHGPSRPFHFRRHRRQDRMDSTLPPVFSPKMVPRS
jgi:hypothetical protein